MGLFPQYCSHLSEGSNSSDSAKMTQSSEKQLIDEGCRAGKCILRPVFVLVGLVLIGLSVLLPVTMGAVTEHRGVATNFLSGYLRSLTPFITNVSMASSFIAVIVILSFDKSRPSFLSVLFGAVTLSVLAAEISLSLYLSLARPLRATAPNLMGIYTLIGLVPFGLACTMFTLASIISTGPQPTSQI